MFNLFKEMPSPEKLVDKLRPYYAEVVSLVNSIDGTFVNLYEAGIFVSSLATLKILTFQKVDPPIFSDEFNVLWVNYLINSYSVDGTYPSKNVVMSRLQENVPIYRELFLKIIDPNCKDKAHDNAVQLMWELFSNCTRKQKPEGEGSFIKLVAASSTLVAIGLNIFKDVHE